MGALGGLNCSEFRLESHFLCVMYSSLLKNTRRGWSVYCGKITEASLLKNMTTTSARFLWFEQRNMNGMLAVEHLSRCVPGDVSWTENLDIQDSHAVEKRSWDTGKLKWGHPVFKTGLIPSISSRHQSLLTQGRNSTTSYLETLNSHADVWRRGKPEASEGAN